MGAAKSTDHRGHRQQPLHHQRPRHRLHPALTQLTGNGKLESADGKLPTPVIKTNFDITGNTVAKIPIADPTFRGIILQKGANRGGFGFFLSNIPADLDPESGGVTLSKP